MKPAMPRSVSIRFIVSSACSFSARFLISEHINVVGLHYRKGVYILLILEKRGQPLEVMNTLVFKLVKILLNFLKFGGCSYGHPGS